MVSLENTTDSVTPDPQAALEVPGPLAPAPVVGAAVDTEHDTGHDAQDELPAGPPIEPPRGAIAEWAITILLLLFLTTTLVQAYVIPTGSMEDTLLIGDHLLVDKLAYAPAGPVSRYLLPYSPVKRGDIIVFRYPKDPSETFLKRVAAMGGDRLEIRNGVLYVNSQPVPEPYAVHHAPVHLSLIHI